MSEIQNMPKAPRRKKVTSPPSSVAPLKKPRPRKLKKENGAEKKSPKKKLSPKHRFFLKLGHFSFSSNNTKKKRALPKKANKKTPNSAISTKHLSFWAISALFVGSVLLGIGLFFLTHPPSKYHFRNPFAVIKQALHFHHKPSPPQYAMDYDTYQTISQHISLENKTSIEAFLEKYPNSSLTMSLRNKWLLLLAENNQWHDFIHDYRPTNNQSVECYYLQALYRTGQQNLALSGVKRLWLAGYKPTSACRSVFSEWQKSGDFKEKYLWPRLQLAMDNNDSASVKQLAQMLPPEKQIWVTTWITLREDPTLVSQVQLPDNAPGRRIIMDGLKQWGAIDVDKAMTAWPAIQSKYHFSTAMTQDFYRTVSLHLALLSDPRAENWFAKILPSYGTTQSRAWQVRFALIHKNWSATLSLIQAMPSEEQQSNMWQYWKARALAATGNPTDAQKIYTKLSSQRQYYGFLAAYQLHQPLFIQQQNYPNNSDLLMPYTQQIKHIKALYQAKQLSQAIPLVQDLLNQLDFPGKYTLANSLAEWGWYAESMNIVNRSPYQNDLKLRFPMPHRKLILALCSQSKVSPALVYSIARQESSFHEDVFSQAGGLGILQLTLSTARQFSPKITAQDLYQPKTNITISITYLKKLTRQFDGHLLLIASAYNAGPQKTRRWQPAAASMPADIWTETRPWEETRNYLKNTLAYDAVYQYLLGKTPDISAFMKDIPKNGV